MKTLFTLATLVIATVANAHESTAPHMHPHGASILPDHAVMLFAIAAIACGAIFFQVWRKGRP